MYIYIWANNYNYIPFIFHWHFKQWINMGQSSSRWLLAAVLLMCSLCVCLAAIPPKAKRKGWSAATTCPACDLGFPMKAEGTSANGRNIRWRIAAVMSSAKRKELRSVSPSRLRRRTIPWKPPWWQNGPSLWWSLWAGPQFSQKFHELALQLCLGSRIADHWPCMR